MPETSVAPSSGMKKGWGRRVIADGRDVAAATRALGAERVMKA